MTFPFDVEREGQTLTITFYTGRPWWQFWAPSSIKFVLDRERAMWLYQAINKFARDLVTEA